MLSIIIWAVVFYIGITTDKLWPWGVIAVTGITILLFSLSLAGALAWPVSHLRTEAERWEAVQLAYAFVVRLTSVAIVFFAGFVAGVAGRWWLRRRAANKG